MEYGRRNYYKGYSIQNKKKTSIVIQNDVWIGQAVTIYGGVTIHNGAVVAGNSVVTKDVPPYAIVGGNPARVIKYRFDEETIKKLLKIEWWYWREEYIKSNGKWFERDAKDFSDHFYPLMKNGNDSDKDELTSFVENNKKKYRAYEKKSVNRKLEVDLTPFDFLFTEKISQAHFQNKKMPFFL